MFVTSARRNPGRVRAVVYAVLVHAVVIGLLVIGFRWTLHPPSGGKVMQAVAVPEKSPRKPEAPDKQAQQQEEQARKKAEAEKAEAEKARQAELKKQQQADQQRQDAARKKLEAAQKLKQQQEQLAQQKRAAALAHQKREQLRQQHAVQSLQEQLAAEEQARQAAAQAARAATVVEQYTALIQQRVNQNWSRPFGSAKGLKCRMKVRLTPSGEVLDAAVVRSSGNPVFDRSAVNAVYKAAPLPLPSDPTLFDNFREIDFIFDPDKDKGANS